MMTQSTGETVALYIVLFFVLIFAVLTVTLLGMIAFALRKLHKQADIALDKVDPVLAKTTDVLVTVEQVTTNVGEKTDTILTRGEELANSLAQKVEGTATVVEKTVTNPLINLASLMAGLTRVFSVMGKGITDSVNSNGHRSKNDGQQ
jgi:hypothetical protein